MASRTRRGSRVCSPTVGEPAGDCGPAWRERLRRRPGWQRCYRAGVFAAGLVLVVLAATLWALSVLLMLPLVLAGLWVWSTEFGWGRRLFEAVRKRARRLRARVTARPARWVLITLGGLAAGVAGSWALGHFRLLNRVKTAIGL